MAKKLLLPSVLDARGLVHGVAPVVVVCLALTLSGAGLSPSLGERIDALIASDEAQPAIWGAFVQDVETGDVVYRRNASMPLLPASNAKLLTTATALDALGSGYRYETTLFFDGDVDGSVMRGDLVLEGTGDPSFGSTQVPGADPLREWAGRIAAMGVTRIEGRLLGDDDAFNDRPYADGWDIDYVTSQSSRMLGVSAGAIAYADNVVEIKIEAGDRGERPRLSLRPTDYLTINNRITTSGRRRGIAVDVGRDVGTETINLRGSIPRSYAGTIAMPVTNPTLFALYSLKQYLQEAGVDVEAALVDVDDLDDKPSYSREKPLFVHISPPLSELLKIVNKESNNFYAEQVFRTFAWGGSSEGGERRVKDLLRKAGAATDGLSIRDGSGLSRKDLISAEAMGSLLVYMRRHPEHEAFFQSMAEGGEPRSTLRYRLRDLPVRAKTGSLEYVRALSGYVTTRTGQTLAFSLLVNNYAAPSYRITHTLDEIVTALATSGAG